MTKIQNIQKDIENIERKIKKLQLQKGILLIQLESIKNNTEGVTTSLSNRNSQGNLEDSKVW